MNTKKEYKAPTTKVVMLDEANGICAGSFNRNSQNNIATYNLSTAEESDDVDVD